MDALSETAAAPTALPHPDMLAAFDQWRLAELATHYASSCPGEIMDNLVEHLFTVGSAAASRSATCADDVLLKLFMLAVVELEPKMDDPPLVPRDPDECDVGGLSAVLWKGILADLNALAPTTVAARGAPHRDAYRARTASHG